MAACRHRDNRKTITMKRLSLYQHTLKKSLKRKKHRIHTKFIIMFLQEFVFLLNEYLKMRFDNIPDNIPSELVSFLENIELYIGEPEKRFKFSLSDNMEMDIVVLKLMSIHMILCRKGYKEVQDLMKGFNSLIPWKDPDLKTPSTSSGSPLPPLTISPTPSFEGNGAGPSGLAGNNQGDSSSSS